MAEQGLNARLGLDATDFDRGLKKSETSLKQFGTQVNRSVPQATQAFTNLSRVVSDAPFGFIAIQNNIDPLLQSFSQLKTSTGSTGAAIKALGASLAGPAGVLFAFSAISSIATTLIQKYGSLGKALEALTNSNNKAYLQQQQLLSIQKEASKAAGEELARVKVLSAVAADVTNSLSNRKEAANELLRVYKEYLPNVSQEALLNNQAAAAINAATEALLNKSLAAAAEKKLADIGAKILENQLAQRDALDNRARAEANYRKQAEDAARQELKGREGVNTATVAYSTELGKAKNRVVELRKEAVGLNAEFRRVTDITKGFAKAAGDAFIKDQKIKAPPKLKADKPITFAFEVAKIELEKGQPALNAALDKLRKERIASTNPAINVPLNITVPQSAFDALKKFGENQYWKIIQDKTTGIINQFDQFLTPVINTAFESLGNGSNIIKAIGQSMKALVVQIGATIAKAAILAAILNSIFPGGAAIGGSTVKGFGSIFKGLLGIGNVAAPNFAGVGGGGLAVTVGGQFNVRGTDLVAVVSQGNQRIGRVG